MRAATAVFGAISWLWHCRNECPSFRQEKPSLLSAASLVSEFFGEILYNAKAGSCPCRLHIVSHFQPCNSVGLVTGGRRKTKTLVPVLVLVTLVTGTSSDLGLPEAASILSCASAFSFSQSLK